jgi:selenocysteine lyase/cysteine desulfurase
MPKAIRIEKTGGPEVMKLVDVEVGPPGPGEAQVRNHAIGLNYIDVYFRTGLYPMPLPAGIGLEGAGVLYVRAERAAALRPYPAGWLSHVDPVRFLVEGHGGHLRYDRPLRARADVFENGTFSAAGCFALETSVGALLALGVERIHAHTNAYLDALEAGLVARGFESLRSADPAGRSCILGVRPPAGPHDVASLSRGLAARGVVTSTPDGVLRFAPHWPNHADEVPVVLDALDDAMTPPP